MSDQPRRPYIRGRHNRPRPTSEVPPETVTDDDITFTTKSVPRNQARNPGRKKPGGIWISLAKKMVADYRNGLVTVASFSTRKEMERARTGVRLPLKHIDPKLKLETWVELNGQRWDLFLNLVER